MPSSRPKMHQRNAGAKRPISYARQDETSAWFKDCIFSNSVFPKDFNLTELGGDGNILQNVSLSNEDCY